MNYTFGANLDEAFEMPSRKIKKVKQLKNTIIFPSDKIENFAKKIPIKEFDEKLNKYWIDRDQDIRVCLPLFPSVSLPRSRLSHRRFRFC